MSSLLDDILQQALSTASWASTPDSGHILKYTRHPSRPGYVLLLTDLSRVYVEVLTAASVPSRLIEIKKEERKRGAKGKKRSGTSGSDDDDDDDGDVVRSSERALKRLEGAMADLRDASVRVEDHDYHDKVVHLEASQCDWIFQMTELKGREALEVLASQLITPMAALLAGAHGTTVESHTKPISAVARLFTETDIATSMVATARDARPERKAPARRPQMAPRKVTPEQDANSDEEYKSPSPAKHSRRKSPSKKPASPSPEPADPNNDDEDQDGGYGTAKKANNGTSRQAKQPEPNHSDDDQGGGDSPSASPPRPAPSQQSKREREEAEEEELEKRMEQMKKKMSSGGGGGRLSKRRGGRFG